jgi:NAD-specific glutamate dehydrogenase
MATTDRWHRWARQTIEDDLIEVRRVLVERVLAEGGDRPADDAVDMFLTSRARALKRVLGLTHTLESGSDQDLAYFMVVVRQVEALAGR